MWINRHTSVAEQRGDLRDRLLVAHGIGVDQQARLQPLTVGDTEFTTVLEVFHQCPHGLIIVVVEFPDKALQVGEDGEVHGG
ncbi:hypothetical protein D9M68_684870 [compost metagenome]